MEWTLEDGRKINLLKIPELRALSGDTKIISILGEERTKTQEGEDDPDEDTRFGYTAWGILQQ